MFPELGQFALLLALVVACVQTLLPLVGAQRGIVAWRDVARPAAYARLTRVAISGLTSREPVRVPTRWR